MNPKTIDKIKNIQHYQIETYLNSLGGKPIPFPEHANKGNFWLFSFSKDNVITNLTFPLPYYETTSPDWQLIHAYESICHGLKKLAKFMEVNVETIIDYVLNI